MSRQRNRNRVSAFLPRVEALEERTVPAAVRLGTALMVTGATIAISDSGDNSAANTSAITVVTNDGGTQTFAGDVAAIFITGNGVTNSVVYTLGGHAEARVDGTMPDFSTRASRSVVANLGPNSKGDAFVLNLLGDQNGEQNLVGANYLFDVQGGGKGGNNIVAHGPPDFLGIDAASSLKLNLFGGSGGQDNITVDMRNIDVGPDVSFGFAGEPPNATATAPGSAAFGLNINTGPFAPPNFKAGAGDKIFANLGFNRFSQGQILANVKGGTGSLHSGTHGGSKNGSNQVGLVVRLPALRADEQMAEPMFNPNFQQSRPFLTLDGGGKGPNTGIFTGPPLDPLVFVTNIQNPLIV
jgi:hypothetical protein